METTFITIHNLLPEANILFASDSIFDILGYHPEEVIGRSCFDYFHPDEVPFARHIHNRGVKLDKAAVLHYSRIRGRNGEWIGCECVFTVVYEVLVASTSIYKGDEKNERRAVEAPAIRRLFTSSPRDPRYHMLEHLSPKFRTPPRASLFEPRAALILNRFTRNLTVMYATTAVASILGVTVDQITGKSFYECIRENCLPEAIRCLESAKANDSIAYLRFWYRDPRHEEDLEEQRFRGASQSSDSDEDGGVQLEDRMDVDEEANAQVKSEEVQIKIEGSSSGQESGEFSEEGPSRINSMMSSGQTSDMEQDSTRTVFDGRAPSRSSTSSLAVYPAQEEEQYEIEAVVSCTSDGLVVVLRRARPLIPTQAVPAPRGLGDGLFAAPWGVNPIRPHLLHPWQNGPRAHFAPVRGPPQEELLNAIREVAVFAWSLVGINGNIADYGYGIPRGEAQPPAGLPIWDPHALPAPIYAGPENQAAQRWAREARHKQRPEAQSQQNQDAPEHQRLIGGQQVENQEPSPAYYDDRAPQVRTDTHPQPVDMKLPSQAEEAAPSIPSSMGDALPAINAPAAPGAGSSANRYLWF